MGLFDKIKRDSNSREEVELREPRERQHLDVDRRRRTSRSRTTQRRNGEVELQDDDGGGASGSKGDFLFGMAPAGSDERNERTRGRNKEQSSDDSVVSAHGSIEDKMNVLLEQNRKIIALLEDIVDEDGESGDAMDSLWS